MGAVLTQNTNWRNVEKALDNLKRASCLSPQDIAGLPQKELESIIRPSGFYMQKAERLKALSGFVLGFGSVKEFLKKATREQLLELRGIGPETADSILLYAANRPFLIADLYTRRIFFRLGLLDEPKRYEEVREWLEACLPKETGFYKQFHSLIVEHAKKFCRKRPLCSKCPLINLCGWERHK